MQELDEFDPEEMEKKTDMQLIYAFHAYEKAKRIIDEFVYHSVEV